MNRRSKAGITIDDVSSLLIEGGYLRAKIRSLSDFDKVAGGLAWGILNSRFSIDVEFVENAHIRDKIRIAENICTALKEDMQCPHDLEPHQIQGLDYPKIVVVLDWLLKRVAAAREENAHFVAEFTMLDFGRRFKTPFSAIAANSHGTERDAVPKTKKTFAPGSLPIIRAPKRVMISSRSTYESPLEHAATVLLEYGLKYQMKDSVLLLQNTAELEGDTEMQRDVNLIKADEQKEQVMFEALLEQMAHHRERTKLGATQMKSLLESRADNDKISRMRSVYEERKVELQRRLQEEEDARNALDSQRTRLEELRQEVDSVTNAVTAVEEEHQQVLSSTDAYREKAQRKLQRIEEQINDIDEIERMLRSDASRSEIFDHLLALLAEEKGAAEKLEEEKEKGKQRIQEAKEECVTIAAKVELAHGDEGRALFEGEVSALTDELSALQEELAKKDQEAMGVARKIDEYPTRAELQQYEVRISELNEEIAWKFEATRLHYNLYNTRTEIVKCLRNQDDIYTQLAQLFDTCLGKNAAKKNAAERGTLLEQTSAIVGQLKASMIKQDEKVQEELQRIVVAKRQYDALIERQQEYQRLVEEMKERLEENSALRSQLAEAEDDAEAEEEPQ